MEAAQMAFATFSCSRSEAVPAGKLRVPTQVDPRTLQAFILSCGWESRVADRGTRPKKDVR